MATSGEKTWPPVGRKHGHQWGENMAVVGEKQMAVDSLLPRRAKQVVSEAPTAHRRET